MEKLDRFSIISTGRKTIESPMTVARIPETYKQVTFSPGNGTSWDSACPES